MRTDFMASAKQIAWRKKFKKKYAVKGKKKKGSKSTKSTTKSTKSSKPLKMKKTDLLNGVEKPRTKKWS